MLAVMFGAMMGIAIPSGFALMRFRDKIDFVITTMLICAVMSTIFFTYVAVTLYLLLSEKSEKFIVALRCTHRRKTITAKTLKSLWIIRLKTGMPFLFVDRLFFLDFMKQYADSMVNLLLTVSH